MVDSVVIGIGVFSLELDQLLSTCCRFLRVRRERKKEFGYSKQSDFEGYIHVFRELFWKDRKNTLHAVDTKLLIHFPVRQIKIER